MQEQKMTIEEVLQDAIQTINSISLPVALHDTAGAQLARIGKNLQAVLAVMLKNAQEAGENQTEEPEENTDEETTEGGGENE